MPVPDPFARTVCLFVKITNGECVLMDGTPLPNLRPDTLAELTISPSDFVKPEDRVRFTEEYKVPFLNNGSRLWVRVKEDKALAPGMKKCLVEKRPKLENAGVFAALKLNEDLELQIRAGKHARLCDCKVEIPELGVFAKSINEAYSKVSIAFEPSRRSHGGNVFQHVYYETGDTIMALNDRRMAMEMMPKPLEADRANPRKSEPVVPDLFSVTGPIPPA
jgi:hypothetical protein